jgi:rhomboid protease GluP
MNKMENIIQEYKKYPVTLSLIGICIVVYLISFLLYGMEMTGEQGLAFGAYNPIYVYVGNQYYRLLTANFVHFGLIHVAVNCYSLYGIGKFIEHVLKTKKYLCVVFVSGLTTTLLPYILFLINGFEAYTVSGGISGIICGLIGSLAALALHYKNVFMDIFKQLAPNIILILIISFLVPSISLSGHVSGMIGGFISTYIILNIKGKSRNNQLYN